VQSQEAISEPWTTHHCQQLKAILDLLLSKMEGDGEGFGFSDTVDRSRTLGNYSAQCLDIAIAERGGFDGRLRRGTNRTPGRSE
jgi:hypothetical protein